MSGVTFQNMFKTCIREFLVYTIKEFSAEVFYIKGWLYFPFWKILIQILYPPGAPPPQANQWQGAPMHPGWQPYPAPQQQQQQQPWPGAQQYMPSAPPTYEEACKQQVVRI